MFSVAPISRYTVHNVIINYSCVARLKNNQLDRDPLHKPTVESRWDQIKSINQSLLKAVG